MLSRLRKTRSYLTTECTVLLSLSADQILGQSHWLILFSRRRRSTVVHQPSQPLDLSTQARISTNVRKHSAERSFVQMVILSKCEFASQKFQENNSLGQVKFFVIRLRRHKNFCSLLQNCILNFGQCSEIWFCKVRWQ